MSIKADIVNIMENNPLARRRRGRLRRGLRNTDITFLAPDCIGGILFHDLGLKFMMPTVNLMMLQPDFLKFVLNLEDYINGKFEFFEHPLYNCPCAILHAEGLQDITVHFTHYSSEEDAVLKWQERVKRINRDNLFVFIEERDGITKEELMKLSNIKARGIVAFTFNEYKELPYAVHIAKYQKKGEVGNILKKNHLNGSREYEKYFDFVKWFNEADGGNYDVKDFVKRKKIFG